MCVLFLLCSFTHSLLSLSCYVSFVHLFLHQRWIVCLEMVFSGVFYTPVTRTDEYFPRRSPSCLSINRLAHPLFPEAPPTSCCSSFFLCILIYFSWIAVTHRHLSFCEVCKTLASVRTLFVLFFSCSMCFVCFISSFVLNQHQRSFWRLSHIVHGAISLNLFRGQNTWNVS